MDVDTLETRADSARGPFPGEGRSAWRPWRGIVEKTPCLWVTWLTEACKRLRVPMPRRIEVDGISVPLVWVQLTFGRRYYFACPLCGRRCETLYFLGRAAGCRICLRLGYRSQMHRHTSIWAYLDFVFDRRPLRRRLWRRYEADDNPVVRLVVEPLRRLLAERIEAMMTRVAVPEGNVSVHEGTEHK